MPKYIRKDKLHFFNDGIEEVLHFITELDAIEELKMLQKSWNALLVEGKGKVFIEYSKEPYRSTNHINKLLESLPDIEYRKIEPHEQSLRLYKFKNLTDKLIERIKDQCLNLDEYSKKNIPLIIEDLRHIRAYQLRMLIEKNITTIVAACGQDHFNSKIAPELPQLTFIKAMDAQLRVLGIEDTERHRRVEFAEPPMTPMVSKVECPFVQDDGESLFEKRQWTHKFKYSSNASSPRNEILMDIEFTALTTEAKGSKTCVELNEDTLPCREPSLIGTLSQRSSPRPSISEKHPSALCDLPTEKPLKRKKKCCCRIS